MSGGIALLENTIQDYSWGSTTAIPRLLGCEPTGAPQAELWMGSHPKAPSVVPAAGKTLLELIEANSEGILGSVAAQIGGGRLPFLFKVLAAAQPLSIQAHPTKEQAVAGYAEEERRGIPVSAPNRNYVDDNHKFVEKHVSERLPSVGYTRAEGTFLSWLDFSDLVDRVDAKERAAAEGKTPEEYLQAWLVERSGVYLNPGSMYGLGSDGYMRLNIGSSRKVVKGALDSLADAVNSA